MALDLELYLSQSEATLIEWPDEFLKILPSPSLHLKFFNKKDEHGIQILNSPLTHDSNNLWLQVSKMITSYSK